MQQSEGFRERLTWLSQLPRGSGHQVVLALIVVKGPVPVNDLAMAAGLTVRTLTEQLRWLEALGVVERQAKGWTLSAATLAMVGTVPGNASGIEETSGTASDGDSGPGIASRSDGHKPAMREVRATVRAAHSTPPPPKRDLTTSIVSNNRKEEEDTGALHSDQVRQQLLSAGVGQRSAKLTELLTLQLDPQYVGRWIDYRQRRLDQGQAMPVGWLIQALQDGDAVPVCSCGKCDECNERRYAKYGDIIQR